jgi:hypothetical protein
MKQLINQSQQTRTNYSEQSIMTATTEKKLRPSPTESATAFAIGTLRRGNDQHMYIVTTDKNEKYRWAKYKGTETEETQVNEKIVENAPKRKAQSKKVQKSTPIQSDASDSEEEKPKKAVKSKKTAKVEPKTPEVHETKEDKAKKSSKSKSSDSEDHEEKKTHVRKSPAEPAKNYDLNDTKTGLDGNEYIVKETKNGIKRWFLHHS